MLTPVFKVSERLDGTVDETACATAAKATMTLSSQRVLLGQACRPTFVDGGRNGLGDAQAWAPGMVRQGNG